MKSMNTVFWFAVAYRCLPLVTFKVRTNKKNLKEKKRKENKKYRGENKNCFIITRLLERLMDNNVWLLLSLKSVWETLGAQVGFC